MLSSDTHDSCLWELVVVDSEIVRVRCIQCAANSSLRLLGCSCGPTAWLACLVYLQLGSQELLPGETRWPSSLLVWVKDKRPASPTENGVLFILPKFLLNFNAKYSRDIYWTVKDKDHNAHAMRSTQMLTPPGSARLEFPRYIYNYSLLHTNMYVPVVSRRCRSCPFPWS